jgi:hypothetical protein
MKKLLLGLALSYAFFRFFRAAWVDSMDFTVYWKAAQNWLHSEVSPYYYDEATRGFVFKYPPWILPLFAPLGFLSFETSRILWAVVEIGCLSYIVTWLRASGAGWGPIVATLGMFWWIWLAHFFAGQFTLVLAAASLWAVPPRDQEPCRKPERLGALAYILTAKVFSLVELFGLWRCFLKPRPWLSFAAMILCANLLLAASGENLGELYRGWTLAAGSGGQELGALVVRGQMNHGFTAGILRWLDVPATNTRADLVVSGLLAILFVAAWDRASIGLRLQERWAGWLAAGLITHPLAWHHSFVLAFPLCVLALDVAWKTPDRRLKVLAVLAPCLIGIFLPEVLGSRLVTPLELVSSKSWGVCLAAMVLVLRSRLPHESTA